MIMALDGVFRMERKAKHYFSRTFFPPSKCGALGEMKQSPEGGKKLQKWLKYVSTINEYMKARVNVIT